MPKPLDPLVKLARENERLKIDNANIRALNKKLLRRGGGYDEFLEELRQVLASEEKFRYESKAAKSSNAKNDGSAHEPSDADHDEIACAAISDLHLSEVVRPEDCNNVNAYNCVIAANRLWAHTQKIKSILRRHMALYTIRKLWCPILGDMISGSIHPELMLTNQLPDPAAAVLASRLMAMFFAELKPLGLPIEIDTVCGNHPRTSLKMPTKAQAATNLDWVVYCALEDRFKEDDQIKVTVHTSQIALKKIYGWRVVIEHGINVRSGKEEYLEDSIRALFDDATFRQATGMQGASFDQLILGHEHRAKLLERTIVNGGYTGQSELGQSWRLAPVRAQQILWGMSKKQVRTWAYNLDVTDIKSNKPENPFSAYAAWFVRRYGKP